MNTQTRPRFGKGVKLRHEPDGGAMLLVPEAALVLNRSAAVALELVNGKRSLAEIIDAVAEQFDVAPERAREDLDDLFDRLAERGFLRSFDSAGTAQSEAAVAALRADVSLQLAVSLLLQPARTR